MAFTNSMFVILGKFLPFSYTVDIARVTQALANWISGALKMPRTNIFGVIGFTLNIAIDSKLK